MPTSSTNHPARVIIGCLFVSGIIRTTCDRLECSKPRARMRLGLRERAAFGPLHLAQPPRASVIIETGVADLAGIGARACPATPIEIRSVFPPALE